MTEKNIINQYLEEISKISVIKDKEEEKRLAILAKNGDEKARDLLVTSNLRFVVNVAKKYQNQGLDFEDLISEGNIGILTAIDKFDPDKGYHFISYAVWWIQQSISKAISEKGRTVRLPANRNNELIQIQKAQKLLRKLLAKEPSAKEIAKETKLSVDTVELLLAISRDVVSLDTPFTQDDSNCLSDVIKSDTLSTEDEIITKDLDENVEKILNELSEKERAIVQMRFGLNGYTPMSLSEVGELYNVTKERIRQIEKRAIKKLASNENVQNLRVFSA